MACEYCGKSEDRWLYFLGGKMACLDCMMAAPRKNSILDGDEWATLFALAAAWNKDLHRIPFSTLLQPIRPRKLKAAIA